MRKHILPLPTNPISSKRHLKTDFPIFPHLLPMEHRSGFHRQWDSVLRTLASFAVALIHVDRIDRHHPLDSRVVPASPKGVPRLSLTDRKKPYIPGQNATRKVWFRISVYWGLTTSLLAWFSFCLMFDPTHVFLAEALAFRYLCPKSGLTPSVWRVSSLYNV